MACNLWMSKSKILLRFALDNNAKLYQCRFYAKSIADKMKTLSALNPRKHLDVESDPKKLCNYVCGANIYIEGNDPELKPDSEYPDWLWNLKTERGLPPLEEFDKDSHEYWEYVKRISLRHSKKIDRVKARFKEFK